MPGRERPQTDYRPVKVPTALMDEVDRLVETGVLGYRSPAEFIIEAIRRRLEELGFRPATRPDPQAKTGK